MTTTAPSRSIPSGSSGTTISALVELDRAIRKSDPPPRSLKIVGWVFLLFIAVGFVALTMAADAGAARLTTAAFFAFVVLGVTNITPLLASRPSGVAPVDVRHLPVSAAALRTASMRVMVRGPGLIAVVASLLIVPLALFTDPNLGLTAQILGSVTIVPAAGIGVIGPRVLGLVFAQAMRSQTGRIVSTIAGVVAVAGVYVVYLLLTQGVIDPRDQTLQLVARILPSGWPVVVAESIDNGRWWLAVAAIAGLVLIVAALYRVWTGRIDQAMYADSISASSASKPRARRRPVTTSATLLVMRTEARMLVTDPQRLGLAIMPLAFIVIGVVLMLTSSDFYGMQYGAPAVVYMVGGMLSNTYGLDRWGFALLITSPTAAPLVIRARMVLATALAVPVGVVGTVVARTIRGTDPSTWPVAVAVIVAGAVTAAAMAALLPAVCPYRVPDGSSISSMSSRGSMTGNSLWISLSAIPAMAALCAPGVAIGLLVDGPAAYLGVLVELAIAVPLSLFVYRRAIQLVARRGPEILSTVTATAPTPAKS